MDGQGEKEKQPERDEAALAAARKQVCDAFDALEIPYEVFIHPPINSAFDRERQDIEVDGLICKNLFLRNKDKSSYYLYTLPIDKRADLVALQKALGETRLSFGDADALWERLRIRPGSVSLLNIVGAMDAAAIDSGAVALYGTVAPSAGGDSETAAKDGTGAPAPALTFLVDSEVLDVPRIGVHPNDNAATIVFAPGRLPKFFAHYGADFAFIDLGHGEDLSGDHNDEPRDHNDEP